MRWHKILTLHTNSEPGLKDAWLDVAAFRPARLIRSVSFEQSLHRATLSHSAPVQSEIELDIAFPGIGYLASWKPIIISHVRQEAVGLTMCQGCHRGRGGRRGRHEVINHLQIEQTIPHHWFCGPQTPGYTGCVGDAEIFSLWPSVRPVAVPTPQPCLLF